MKTAVLYKLDWHGAEGRQPYGRLAERGLSFEGGFLGDGTWYLGVIDGNMQQLDDFLASEDNEYSMRILSESELAEFYLANTEDINDESFNIHLSKQDQYNNFISQL